MKQTFVLLLALFLSTLSGMRGQSVAIDSLDAIHNFGTIAEERGSVSHTFMIRNVSDKPMVILRVNTDCGCTTPTYDRKAIPPGEKMPIVITFDPLNRPGSFVKYTRVYTSIDAERPITLTIKGNVATLGRGLRSLSHLYQQQIGPLEVSNLSLEFPLQPADRENTIRLMVNNPTASPIEVSMEHVPAFFTISKTRFVLQPQEPEELYLTAKAFDQVGAGIWSGVLGIQTQVVGEEQRHAGGVMVRLAMPPRFDYNASSYAEADLKTYHRLPEQPTDASVYEGEVSISNRGDSPLLIYAVDSQQTALKILEFPQEIAAGGTGVVRYRIDLKEWIDRSKTLKCDFDILMGDVNAPLRNVLLAIPAAKR